MKKLFIPTIVVLAALMLSIAAQPVSAGVEPSPFQPQENELINFVNHLDTNLELLDRDCTIHSDSAKGLIRHRSGRVLEFKVSLDELQPMLFEYISLLPGEVQRGRPAEDVLAGGIETLEATILTVDEYLLTPGTKPDMEFRYALMKLRLSAEATLPLIIHAWELVGGVEPSPF